MASVYGSWTTVNQPEEIQFEKIKRPKERKSIPNVGTPLVINSENVEADDSKSMSNSPSAPPSPKRVFKPIGFTTVGYVGEAPMKKRRAAEDLGEENQPTHKKAKLVPDDEQPKQKKGKSITINIGNRELEHHVRRRNGSHKAIEIDDVEVGEEEEEEYNEELFEKELAQVQGLSSNGPLVPGMKAKSNEPLLSRRQLKRERRKKRKKIEETIVDLTGPDVPINLDADEADVIKVINAWAENKTDWLPLLELTKFLKTKFQFNSWTELCGMRAKNFLWRCENVITEVFEGELHLMKYNEEIHGKFD